MFDYTTSIYSLLLNRTGVAGDHICHIYFFYKVVKLVVEGLLLGGPTPSKAFQNTPKTDPPLTSSWLHQFIKNNLTIKLTCDTRQLIHDR